MSTLLQNLVERPYCHGFITSVETDAVPKGLSEDVIRLISSKKGEPAFELERSGYGEMERANAVATTGALQ